MRLENESSYRGLLLTVSRKYWIDDRLRLLTSEVYLVIEQIMFSGSRGIASHNMCESIFFL